MTTNRWATLLEAPRPKQAQREAEPGSRVRTTLYVDANAFAEARGAVTVLGAMGIEPGNLSAFVDEAVRRELERLRRLHTQGRPFPSRGSLPGGRSNNH